MSKVIRVKSKNDSNMSIQYGSFVIKFNNEGIGSVNVYTDEEEDNLNKTVQIFKDFIEFVSSEEMNYLGEDAEEIIENLTKENELLKTDNNSLKAENDSLKEEIFNLRNKIGELEESITKNIELIDDDVINSDNFDEEESSNLPDKEESENKVEEIEDNNKENKTEEENKVIEDHNEKLRSTLNAQTVAELKELLASMNAAKPDIFKESEYKKLTKKDDIVNYLVKNTGI